MEDGRCPVGGGEFVVADGDVAPLLEVGKAALDDIAAAVVGRVERGWASAGRATAEAVTDLVGVLRPRIPVIRLWCGRYWSGADARGRSWDLPRSHDALRPEFLAPPIGVDDATFQHCPAGLKPLADSPRAEFVEATEGREVKAAEASVGHVDVIPMDSHSGKASPPAPTCQPHTPYAYTLNCEEP